MVKVTNDFLFIYILLTHFLADFCLQTHEQAMNKSTSDKWLTYHVATYSLVWLLATLYILPVSDFNPGCIGFAAITFFAHWVTDYCTSRIGKQFWDKKDLHNGFIVVGFDQILHYLQLWYTFKLLL